MSPLASVRAFATAAMPDPALIPRVAYQIPMARGLARRYGHATAARYLCKRGWSLESALFILTGQWPWGRTATRNDNRN